MDRQTIQNQTEKIQTPGNPVLYKKQGALLIAGIALILMLLSGSIGYLLGVRAEQSKTINNQHASLPVKPTGTTLITLPSIPPTATIIPTTTLIGNLSPVPTVDMNRNTWQTYTTADYKIQYPATWFVSESKVNTPPSCIEITDILNGAAAYGTNLPHPQQDIAICYYPTGEMPSDFPRSNGGIGSNNHTIKPFHSNGYTGIRGIEDAEPNGPADIIYLANPRAGYIQLIQYIGDTSIFNQMLSTFIFTN